MKRIQQRLIIAGVIAAWALVASCAPNYATNGSPPTPEPTPRPTSLPTASTGHVTLRIAANSYQTSSTITVTVSNQSSQSIYFPDHLTNCTVILLQRQVNANWEAVNSCASLSATRLYKLAAGQILRVELVPSSVQPWPAGLYHATLSYSIASTSGPQTTIYSAGFQVA